MSYKGSENESTDAFTRELIEGLFNPSDQKISETRTVSEKLSLEINSLFTAAENTELTKPVIDLFVRLKSINRDLNITPDVFGISKDALLSLAKKHQNIIIRWPNDKLHRHIIDDHIFKFNFSLILFSNLLSNVQKKTVCAFHNVCFMNKRDLFPSMRNCIIKCKTNNTL